VYYYQGATSAANSAIGCVNAQNGALAGNTEVNRPIVINNFLGFISSLSTPVLDLNDTGDIYIEIRWASPSVLWATTNVAAATAFNTTTGCQFNNLRMTCSKINFESSEYSTFQKGDCSTIKNLVLNSSGTNGSLITFNEYLGAQVTNANTDATLGDGFNQSYYFMRAGVDIATSQWSINSTNIDPYPLPPSEIWNQNLIAIGNANIDFGTSGVHAGCVSLWHFLKYYFCHILSLENLSGDGQMWRSGLSGNGSTVNINYSATFNGTNTENISPVIFCRSTKVLSIRDGHIISVV